MRVNSSDKAQYSENKELEMPVQINLSSRLRLAGLTPDIARPNQRLRTVDAEALRQQEAHLQEVIEKVNYYKTYSAIPEQRLVGSSHEMSSNNYWPAGFTSSLASFK